jgi:hypothetical protein
MGLGGALLGVLAVIVVFGSTCSAPANRTLPPPSSTSSTEPEPTTTSIDWSQVSLAPVEGVTTTTLLDTGDAILTGVVTGPEGNVPGATVRIERLVGDAVQTKDVLTREDGTWLIEGLPGGRFRVRAFVPPSLTMLEPEVFFLADGDTRELRLPVTLHQGLDVRSGATPSSPMVGDAVNLAVRVSERVVGDDGIARTQPLAGVAVQLRSSGWTALDGPRSSPTTTGGGLDDDDDDDGDRGTTTGSGGDVRFTGDDGIVVYEFRCDRETSVTASVTVGSGPEEQTFPLEVPSCGPRPTTTTTTTEPAGVTSTSLGRSTTTDGTTTTTEDG